MKATRCRSTTIIEATIKSRRQFPHRTRVTLRFTLIARPLSVSTRNLSLILGSYCNADCSWDIVQIYHQHFNRFPQLLGVPSPDRVVSGRWEEFRVGLGRGPERLVRRVSLCATGENGRRNGSDGDYNLATKTTELFGKRFAAVTAEIAFTWTARRLAAIRNVVPPWSLHRLIGSLWIINAEVESIEGNAATAFLLW